MSDWNDVRSDLWSDPAFEPLSVEAKLLYVWSFTNPRCNVAGLYKVSKAAMGFDTRVADVDAALSELEAADFVRYRNNRLWVRWRVAQLRSPSANHAKSIARTVQELPGDDELRRAFLDAYGQCGWLAPVLGSPSEGPLKPLPGAPIEQHSSSQEQHSSNGSTGTSPRQGRA